MEKPCLTWRLDKYTRDCVFIIFSATREHNWFSKAFLFYRDINSWVHIEGGELIFEERDGRNCIIILSNGRNAERLYFIWHVDLIFQRGRIFSSSVDLSFWSEYSEECLLTFSQPHIVLRYYIIYIYIWSIIYVMKSFPCKILYTYSNIRLAKFSFYCVYVFNFIRIFYYL